MTEEYSLGNYTFVKTIGEGTFGKVKLAIHKLTQEKVAIKILEKNKIKTKKDLERIEKEIKYMKILNHPNIVKIYEIIEDNNNFYISMEYVPGGELFNYIVKNKYLTENEASFFYSQIIHIIKEIHKHKICHRDLKPENLLLTQNKTIKLIDFGLSNEYNDYLITPCGSPCYASPEVIKGMKYSGLGIDLWASGIILYSMLCGYLPFDDKNNDELFKKILKCKFEFPKKNTNISENAKDLICKILRPEPSKRISIDEILEHPFLTYGNKKYKERIKMDINKQDKLIIDYMTKIMRLPNENSIRKNIKENRHNFITTIFNLLKKKYNEGRFDYNIFQTNHRDTINAKIPSKYNLSKTLNTETDYNEIKRSKYNEKIFRKANKNNNIIIINNNNNIVNQPNKMNYLFNPIFTDNSLIKDNYNKIIKKIDTSISVEKGRKSNKSPENELYNNNRKIQFKNILYKKYINSSASQKNKYNKPRTSIDKNAYLINKKDMNTSFHLKAKTNLHNLTFSQSIKAANANNLESKTIHSKNSFFNADIKNNFRRKYYKRIRINSNLDNPIFHQGSPDDKNLYRYNNYARYLNSTAEKNKEKLNTIENEHHHGGYRKSINEAGKKKYILESINTNDSNSSMDENGKNNFTINQKEHFYKKSFFNKLNKDNKKLKINRLTLNDNSLTNSFANNNLCSERENISREMYPINKTMTNNNFRNNPSKRANIRTKGIKHILSLNDSLTYSKKICSHNKAFSKTNNYLMLSTNLKIYQINERISKFCAENNLYFRQNIDKYIIIIKRDNEFLVDIKLVDGSYVIKFTHEKGDESQTKIFMNNLFAEIAK